MLARNPRRADPSRRRRVSNLEAGSAGSVDTSGNLRGRCTLCTELAVEDQDRLALTRRVLARGRRGWVRDGEQRLVHVGDVGQVDGVGDVSALKLVVEPTVNDDESFDASGVDARLDVVELNDRAPSEGSASAVPPAEAHSQ